jgi:hypothetical protein
MNKKIYLALLLFFPSLIFAQSNYQPGVIVNIKGDTTHGFIDYKEWAQNSESIDFKTQLKSKPRQLGAKDIQYFGVDGYEYYRCYTVSITLNSMELDQLTSIPDTSTKTATVFLKILQTGKNVTLFSYTDDIKERFYVSDKTNGQPAELVFLRYLNPDEGGVVNRKYYQGQLGVIAENYHLNLTGLVSHSNYDEVSLSKVIDKINGAKSSLPI